ncbi:MAG TPA: hypothetical protein VFV23_13935 [Verrucomicrobiae bacterium]|nr:hypothetical protein [Verrucomicrobiae bacterium]
MFELEQAIFDWRQQMLAAGIQSPVPLDELEIHLREEIERRIKAGEPEKEAFQIAVQEIGQTNILKTEFAKVGVTVYERLQRLGCALAGIPEYQLAMNMNAPNQNLEPRWATYLKNAAYVLPALFFWIGSVCLVVPKLKEICAQSGTRLPDSVLLALSISQVIKENFIFGSLAFLAVLVLLEWRSRRWPHYRRMVFGIAAYLLNLIAFVLMATMLVFAVVAAANSLHPK